MRSLTRVEEPASEPVTLAELKQFARIDHDDEDGMLGDFLSTARQAAEEFTRRAFITQGWKLTLDLACNGSASLLGDGVYDLPVSVLYGEMSGTVTLPRHPVQSVASVVTYDDQDDASTYDDSNYTVDTAGGRLVLNRDAQWPTGLRQAAAIEITTVNGYGDDAASVPKPIRTAILMHAAQLYETRGLCGCDSPPACEQILRQYRVLTL